eukprot:CAMPEP_0181436854 /NCGR_PEP_ID=MMETSP1110-20121109/21067_1 /TAXON_ID=174948 /ORGANISM="Symbiodinium sp., Strain CCMP421" /LENGTH=54 /DNA_ID=CAMNT_0023560441 /DNA_START=101 /DNA_END=265 /DNA_ORIENTATION=+
MPLGTSTVEWEKANKTGPEWPDHAVWALAGLGTGIKPPATAAMMAAGIRAACMP